ncbi:SGNH/GDSL hydrolase family protein [uncultured Chitinophaga sp.]|uniref:SGNH/GDSL hydrolase family protein n=1 Tax=uncultured Chitinophaga sp. TaxID=339340 RepID=UPI0025DDB197|nr:SGNH/GDSL hydrolase family protein [uncultured Chitinophaga sp.]
MKTPVRYLFMLICLFASGTLYAQTISQSAKRVLFLGNSITYAGQYINYIETYWLLKHPGQHLEFINMGLPSETVSGLSEEGHADGKFPRPDLHERLNRIMKLVQPDVVFACYGMNDGIYQPFDEDRFNRFKTGIEWLHDQYAGQGVRIIHLTPPVYDEEKGGAKGYAAVLDRYSDWLLAQRKALKWEVADLHYPMKKVLDAGTHLAGDGVHPGNEGHWIMAKAVLLYLGEKKVAKANDITTAINNPKTTDILKLVSQRQAIMKDAWLTAAGHKRPMTPGLPLAEAQEKAKVLDQQIKDVLKRE